MKKIVILLIFSFVLFACNKDDEPSNTPEPQLLKVIDYINIKEISSNNPQVNNYRTQVFYNENNEISRLEYYLGDILDYASTFEYENNRPITSTITACCDGDYQITYTYANDIFTGWSSAEYGNVPFNYFPESQLYTNIGEGYGNYAYYMTPANDVSVKATNVEYAYNFNSAHKGPLYNVTNKKWISLFWHFGRTNYNVLTTHTYTDIYNETLGELYTVSSEYDSDNFITNYNYTINNKTYEVTFIYKSI